MQYTVLTEGVNMGLTEEVVSKAKALGADLVGIAPIERFQNAPLRMSPQGLLPEAKSVIVAAIHHTDASVELGGEPTPHDCGPYNTQGYVMNPKLDDISFWLARFLEAKGHKTLPVVSSNIWRYHGYKDLRLDFAPDLAHRYAAVAAGMGEIGWNGLLLTPEFGPRVRVVSVITAAELRPSPMYHGRPLCDKCMACVKNCPTDAFRQEVRKINRIEIGGRTFEFPDINKWRCGWAENFCLNLAHKIPEQVDEKTVLKYLEKYGWLAGEEGYCLKFCMIKARRRYDPEYCRSPRRRKNKASLSKPELAAKIAGICKKNSIDFMVIGRKEDFSSANIHPEYHLPDVASVISLGLKTPDGGAENDELRAAFWRRLNYAAWEVSHFLDICGHSGVSATRIADNQVAQKFGVFQSNALFATVLTSARLPFRKVTPSRKAKAEKINPDKLRSFCKAAGADLVGFFSSGRFQAFQAAASRGGPGPQTRAAVYDRNFVYGAYHPEPQQEEVKLKGPEDWLPGAQSVIVLGLHYPHAALDIAKVTPAETVGPYAFVQFETLHLLRDMSIQVARRLEQAGRRATFTSDLTGLASKVASSRGLLPDMRANLFAAVLAGLAYPGVHGCPITKEYGVRQRFIAIVTDLPLPDDPLYNGKMVCDLCPKPCIKACPTFAISNEITRLKIENRTFYTGKIDGFACDWAKRYGLNGKDGSAYMGFDIKLPVPKKRSAEQIAAAIVKVDWGMQKRHLDIAEECLRVCPAHDLERNTPCLKEKL